MKEFFTKSEHMSQEYCATVVRLGEIQEIPGACTVAKTLVNGRTIVVGKDNHKGDVMIYCSNESQLNKDFLAVNNLFSHTNMNCNADEVEKWLEQNTDATPEEQQEYLRTHRGYFDDNARVRMKKLAGELSMGVLFGVDTLKKWCPNLDVNIEDLVGTDFDTVNGELFVQAYMPPVKEQHIVSKDGKRNKKLRKFNRMIPGQFSFHYDTQLFERCVNRFKPDTVVTISNKLHGTSFIIGNVKVKAPRFGGLYAKMFNGLPKCLQFTKEVYDVIYSSRSVIKNSAINPGKRGYSAGLDACFDKYYELLKPYIDEGMTIYGEIIGYCEGSNSFIQKIGQGYDYRCKPGENQLMIYRIVTTGAAGKKYEWNVKDIVDFTIDLKNRLVAEGNKNLADRLHPIDIFYHGQLKDLYPNLNTTNHWHENLLECMKNDKVHFGMEQNEPMCRNSVPREGIVIRIDDDPIAEAFKLKCTKFLNKEAQAVDSGEADAEMQERYGEN